MMTEEQERLDLGFHKWAARHGLTVVDRAPASKGEVALSCYTPGVYSVEMWVDHSAPREGWNRKHWPLLHASAQGLMNFMRVAQPHWCLVSEMMWGERFLNGAGEIWRRERPHASPGVFHAFDETIPQPKHTTYTGCACFLLV